MSEGAEGTSMMSLFRPDRPEKTQADELLSSGIQGLRQEACSVQASLSDAARSAILAAAAGADHPRTALVPLFLPFRRFVVAGAIPVLLACALLFVVRNPSVTPGERPTNLAVAKEGDRVVFLIANGSRSHRVTKSPVPHRFDGSAGVSVSDGTFVDRVGGGGSIVYYRVD